MTWNQDYTPPTAQPNSKPLPRLAGETTADNPWPVSLLSEKFHMAVERWPSVWVAGQITQINTRRQGSAYITLRDDYQDIALEVNGFGQFGEFSFQSFAPGAETGFLHTHKNHEELYFFLKAQGEFQVDGQVFPVSEGSVVRVAPAGKCSVRNNGNEPLVMLCVQYRGNTFTAEDAADGVILNEKVLWK